MNWHHISEAPEETWMLVAFGSKASGPLGHVIASLRGGVWRDQNGERVETDGYSVFAWMPLPDLPNPGPAPGANSPTVTLGVAGEEGAFNG